MRVSLWFTFHVVSTCSIVSGPLMAQQAHRAGYQNFQQRGQQVEGILKNLVHAQIQAQPRAMATTHPVSGQTSQTLQSFADEAAMLIEDLRYEERFSAYIRGLVGDAIQIKASADILIHQSSTFSTALFSTEYAELDRLWRVLAYRIRQTPNMGGTLLRRVGTHRPTGHAKGREGGSTECGHREHSRPGPVTRRPPYRTRQTLRL